MAFQASTRASAQTCRAPRRPTSTVPRRSHVDPQSPVHRGRLAGRLAGRREVGRLVCPAVALQAWSVVRATEGSRRPEAAPWHHSSSEDHRVDPWRDRQVGTPAATCRLPDRLELPYNVRTRRRRAAKLWVAPPRPVALGYPVWTLAVSSLPRSEGNPLFRAPHPPRPLPAGPSTTGFTKQSPSGVRRTPEPLPPPSFRPSPVPQRHHHHPPGYCSMYVAASSVCQNREHR